MRHLAAIALAGVLAIFVNVGASAQPNPQQVLAGMIQQLQTGTPNPNWYGQQLWFTIAQQTNNTGYYPALAQLGPVAQTNVIQQQQLPTGMLYAMTATHQNGTSTWNLGVSHFNRIEYANFNIGTAMSPLPGSPAPNPQPGPTPPPPVAQPGPNSDSCKKFPNLC